MSNNRIVHASISTLLFLLVLIFNYLANALPINGMNTGEISDLYPSLFTPAGITFSIWGAIYLLLAGFVFNQWVAKNDVQKTELLKQINSWFWITCISNASWIIAWHFLFPGISLLIMLVFLYALIKIFIILTSQKNSSRYKKYFLLTFSVYLAWLCVATIANTAAWLMNMNLSFYLLSEQVWTLIMMAIAAALAVLFLLKYHSYAFSLVIIWALMGIAIRWQTTDKIFFYTAIGLCAIILGVISGTLKLSTKTNQ
jgi:translocator protein